jgi:hypothetical protein
MVCAVLNPSGSHRSRLRCLEVGCVKGVANGLEKRFPAERLAFRGKGRGADLFNSIFLDFSTTTGLVRGCDAV